MGWAKVAGVFVAGESNQLFGFVHKMTINLAKKITCEARLVVSLNPHAVKVQYTYLLVSIVTVTLRGLFRFMGGGGGRRGGGGDGHCVW